MDMRVQNPFRLCTVECGDARLRRRMRQLADDQIQFFFKRDLRKIHVRAAQVFDRLRAHVNDVLAAADIQKEGRTTALFFRHAVRGAEKQQLHIAIRFFADKLLCFSKQIILFFKTLVKFFKTVFACSK